jgi:hypothetical protein
MLTQNFTTTPDHWAEGHFVESRAALDLPADGEPRGRRVLRSLLELATEVGRESRYRRRM